MDYHDQVEREVRRLARAVHSAATTLARDRAEDAYDEDDPATWGEPQTVDYEHCYVVVADLWHTGHECYPEIVAADILDGVR
jgi:hypothetical protein